MSRMKIKVKLRNLSKVLNNLSKTEKTIALNALNRGIHKGGFIVEKEVKKRAPVDTGRLRRAIHTKLGKMKATVISGVDYNNYLEFGTSRMKAKPHFRPGMEASKSKVVKVVEKEVIRAIRKPSKFR